MKTIVKILLLVSTLTLSGCMVVPARQHSSYLEGNGGGYSSGVYITPPPVYFTPYYGYSPYRGGYNRNFSYRRGWSNNRGWNNNRGWGGHHHHHRH